MPWWKLTLEPNNQALSSDELDGLAYELVSAGAQSTCIETPPIVGCFLKGSEQDAARFEVTARELGFEVASLDQVEEHNWHTACSEVWEPVVAGSLSIVPVKSESEKLSTSHCETSTIFIVPGQGFGTGHHPTTLMILEQLSRLAEAGTEPAGTILDFGTGSGILAIAAHRLFELPVTGSDNDPTALDNAHENVRLNGLEGVIRLDAASLSEYTESFGLVTANVYGEVLIESAAQLERLTAEDGMLLLSGITELVRDQVVEAYSGPDWHLVREEQRDGWVCLVLQRTCSNPPSTTATRNENRRSNVES